MSVILRGVQRVPYCLPAVYQTTHFNPKISQSYLLPKNPTLYSIQRRNDCTALFATSLICFTAVGCGALHVYRACKYYDANRPVSASFSYAFGSLMIASGFYIFGEKVLNPV